MMNTLHQVVYFRARAKTPIAVVVTAPDGRVVCVVPSTTLGSRFLEEVAGSVEGRLPWMRHPSAIPAALGPHFRLGEVQPEPPAPGQRTAEIRRMLQSVPGAEQSAADPVAG